VDLRKNFDLLLERAVDWVSDMEALALEEGRELTSEERMDARLAGVTEPARIRVLVVPSLPVPEDELLARANAQARVLAAEGQGVALGYAVLLREGCESDRRLLVHEFAHIGQYERYGGLEGFLREYLGEIIEVGYENAPLETEARMRCNAVVGPERQG
jgi:hypothetical protein